jgi:hypothetical protein
MRESILTFGFTLTIKFSRFDPLSPNGSGGLARLRRALKNAHQGAFFVKDAC